MIKITAKLIKNHKTIKTATLQNLGEYESSEFYHYVSTLAQKLDIETPIIIAHHRECYENFNSLKFTKDDFIDAINFDYLYLENDDR